MTDAPDDIVTSRTRDFHVLSQVAPVGRLTSLWSAKTASDPLCGGPLSTI